MTGTWNWRVGMEPWSKAYKRRSEYANTLVTELDLVCDYAQWPHISTSLFYVGSLLGNIIFGNIADRFRTLETWRKKLKCRFGRRTAFFLLLFMATSLGVAIAFAPNYTVFTILRLVSQSFEGINKWIDGTESWTYTATKSQTKHSLSIEALVNEKLLTLSWNVFLLRSINGLTFPALFQIPFILCKFLRDLSYENTHESQTCGLWEEYVGAWVRGWSGAHIDRYQHPWISVGSLQAQILICNIDSIGISFYNFFQTLKKHKY